MSNLNVEEIKIKSKGLRGGIAETLVDNSVDGFSEDDRNLIKFHGLYQQKHRDRIPPPGQEGASFMVRGRIPGGRLSAEQWLAWDKMANDFGGGSLRLTTRQSVQLHGVLKNNLSALMKAVSAINQTTAGACGDVVRNVTQAVNPRGLPKLDLLDEPATLLSNHFLAATSAWAELWLGEERKAVPGDEKEPIYGETYLPRKFKIAVTLAGNNSVDLHTNDLALAATLTDSAQLEGWFVFAGGGMGMTHNKPETYPRIASLLGWVPHSHFLQVAEAVVGVHRDFGDRSNRKHARLKYVVEENGVEWMQREVESRLGIALVQRDLPEYNTPDYLGWQERQDGSLALGLHILAGRLLEGGNYKEAVRTVVGTLGTSVQITADQDLILLGIPPARRAWVEEIFNQCGQAWKSPTPLHARALTCPALPTCGLALTEAERIFSGLLDSVQKVLEKHGLLDRAPVLRLTGCPNGCARPYAAEIGIVGQAAGRYAIFVGGEPEGTRIARLYTQKIKLEDIASTLEPILVLWKAEANPSEALGTWICRVGFEQIKARLLP